MRTTSCVPRFMLPARMFIDTTEGWDGDKLQPADYDKQRVRVKVHVDLSRGRWPRRTTRFDGL